MGENDVEKQLVSRFIDQCRCEVENHPDLYQRVPCQMCSSSRCLYCPECLQITVASEKLPKELLNLRLPFNVDILLDDRRKSSTGVQLKALVDSIARIRGADVTSCRLFDVKLEASLPDYDQPGTFLLFPGPDSVPLSSVATKHKPGIQRLVALDCKWTKQSIQRHAAIASLPRVHLDNPPKRSLYWRWHAAGDGMISTVEALYYSAHSVASIKKDWDSVECERLVYMLWVFGMQRALIEKRYRSGEVQAFRREVMEPFGEAYQKDQIERRQRHPNYKQKQRKSS